MPTAMLAFPWAQECLSFGTDLLGWTNCLATLFLACKISSNACSFSEPYFLPHSAFVLHMAS